MLSEMCLYVISCWHKVCVNFMLYSHFIPKDFKNFFLPSCARVVPASVSTETECATTIHPPTATERARDAHKIQIFPPMLPT